MNTSQIFYRYGNLPPAYAPAHLPNPTGVDVPVGQRCGNCGFMDGGYCHKWEEFVAVNYWCLAWMPIDNFENVLDTGKPDEVQVQEMSSSSSFTTKKYETINFKPPEGVAKAVKKGLEWRAEYNRGGTEVGVARARDLSNRTKVSPKTIGRMVSYFARHEVDLDAPAAKRGNDGYPSAGIIAWYLWGGFPGRTWANKVYRQMKREDEQD